MVVMVGATLTWGLASKAAAPQLFSEDDGLLASNTTVSWLLILGLMAISAAIAIAALVRGNRSSDSNFASAVIAGQTAP
jgi:hypothetical protein